MLYRCSQCRRLLRIPQDALGRRMRCRGCGEIFVAPGKPPHENLDDKVANWLLNDAHAASEALQQALAARFAARGGATHTKPLPTSEPVLQSIRES